MIYLKPEVQQKLIPLFHYALKPGGYLVLGASETVGNFPDLFAPGGGKGRLYKAKPSDGRRPEHAGLGLPIRHDRSDKSPPREAGRGAAAQTEGFLQRYLLRRHTPTAVFVNRKREVVYVHGSTGRYFELAPGVARMDVTEMARGAISLPLSQALREAFRGEKLVERSGIRFEGDGGPAIVHLTADPIREDESDYVVSLENELAATRERLHTTVNNELQTKNEELSRANAEMRNFLDVLEGVLVVFLDATSVSGPRSET
jgi:two-component system, chemotaxis family, CheB/CheR fusion protein